MGDAGATNRETEPMGKLRSVHIDHLEILDVTDKFSFHIELEFTFF